MDRRQFLLGSTALAVTPSLPVKTETIIGVDLAKGSDETIIFMSNPSKETFEVQMFMDRIRNEIRKSFLIKDEELTFGEKS